MTTDTTSTNSTELYLLATDYNFPKIYPPEGFRIVNYVQGDVDTWVRIQPKTEKYITITKELYIQQFGKNHERLSQRQFFIVDNKTNKAVGTSTSWYLDVETSQDDKTTENWGRVHWVCVLEEYQGKGLGKALVSHTLSKLVELGHSKIFLYTDTRLENAVHIYKNCFKFVEQDKGLIARIKKANMLAVYD